MRITVVGAVLIITAIIAVIFLIHYLGIDPIGDRNRPETKW